MFTVALIGPDGAGKTTIGRSLAGQLPFPTKYVYMGVNLESSNLVLPTTRLFLELKRLSGQRPDMAGPPDPTKSKPRPKSILGKMTAGVKASLRLLNQLGEEWFRQTVIWIYQAQGFVVILDRHFFSDYYAHDVANTDPHRSLTSRIHGFILKHFYPRPELVIFLDAPPEVLFARKGEGTLELLEHRRQEYLRLREAVPCFVTVDASQPQAAVAQAVAQHIVQFHQSPRGSA